MELKPVIGWLAARLREPSTYLGLGTLLSATGIMIAPDLWKEITAVGMGIGGILGVVLAEGGK